MTPPRKSCKWDDQRKPDREFLPSKRQRTLLLYVWEYGFLTLPNLMGLEGISKRRCDELMAPLFHNGYINRPCPKRRARYDFMFWCLTRKGAKTVAQELNVEYRDLQWKKEPIWNQVEHDSLVNDFRIILSRACAEHPDFEVVDWVNETQFRSWADKVKYVEVGGRRVERVFIVDGYIKVRREFPDDRPRYFRMMPEIEVADKSNPRFADDKVLRGRAYIKSPIFETRFGSQRGRYLFILGSEEKLNNYRMAAEQALDPDYYPLFYFSLFHLINEDTILFEPIWLRPGDKQPIALFKTF